MEARHLLKELKDTGWYLGESEGGCRQYVHRERPDVITVCVRYNDILGPDTRASVDRASEASAADEHRIMVERTETGFSAFSPDVPGAAATGDSEQEVRARLTGAIALHLRTVRERSGRQTGD